MKNSARAFYLAVFALLGSSSHAADSGKGASKVPAAGPDVCAISPKAIVSDACASFSTLDDLNRDLKPALSEITQKTDFFSYYRLNLYGKECPFWNDDSGLCGNRACAVNTLENEEDIPLVWRAKHLGQLEGPKAVHPEKSLQEKRGPAKPLQGELGEDVGESCVVEYDDECDERDYCMPEDKSTSAKGDYVSLVDNPERFTGYSGVGPRQVWDAIYRENCFSKDSFPHSASLGSSPPAGPAAFGLKSVLEKKGREQALVEQQKTEPALPFVAETGLELEGECVEKRVFYRVISGMHTSISTHLCWDFLNQTTGEWGPNLQCYKDRLHQHADRVSNLYFNYALVLRAITKLGPSLMDYTFCSGDPSQDRDTKYKVQGLLTQAGTAPRIFDESLMFVNGEGPSLKEDFRNRFRNVSRLMDCVGCDKCRLWGKLQTAGYGAALKVLFEFDNNALAVLVLKRTELVALFNTLARISDSLTAIHEFRLMVEAEELHSEHTGHHHMSDRVTKPHHVVPDKPFTDLGQADFEDFEKEEVKREPRKPRTLSDDFWTEINTVWKAYKYVVRGWINAPKNM
ncbi:endoplasmic reticulum Oxidoreductin 1-domain-containing protein [Calycina marina]|uniref:Endoplasmic reticulum Oxidoreductin 1-domain-containing protein n=1 Tax=Calycina marina TaxID=1763456 RepID=A0A9P7Z824_9HELO|nr:endoplasmic reticulum Oxidoreductin 1-domain-containing protein [Calycina marina]